MQKLFSGFSAWHLVVQSDWMTKCVLGVLFITSVVCVAIIAFKFVLFRREKANLYALIVQARRARTFNDFLTLQKEYSGLGSVFLAHGLAELKLLLQKYPTKQESDLSLVKGKLSSADIDRFAVVLEQSVDQLLAESEQFLPILGTSAAVAPLMGLFGTIWGLIHAFLNISQARSADISVIAPGIAEALITTLAGLIVAIPALIFFHYFLGELHRIERQLFNLSERFFVVVKQTFTT